ncbi:histidine phosphatase family protein [Kangiella marina]|uniref:Phosphoglycerate mutase family protein n=1 Tax=Kangiella marina TaxID=1079178 RepID=A0ABP8IAZ7_9GAMM
MKLLFTTMATLVLGIVQPSASAAEINNRCNDYDVFVLRHLQKQDDGTKDPSLNEVGQQQAQQLSTMKALSTVNHGFYTPYKRTYETLQYVDVEKSIYDPTKPEELIQRIKDKHCGETVVVVGHSNTVPSIITALGGSFGVTYAGKPLKKEPTVYLSEQDYGSIFRVTYHNERIHQQLYHLMPAKGKVQKN